MAGSKSTGRKLAKTLLNKNGSLKDKKPELAKQWDFKKNKIKPSDITLNSNKKFWWICSKRGHSFYASPNSINRSKSGNGCKKCYNIDRSEIVRKYYLNKNLTLDKGDPYLAKQWDSKKNKRKPSEINCKSGFKAWWNCENGHSFKQVVSKRYIRGDGCTECGHYGISRIQIIIFYELKLIFKNIIDDKKIGKYRIDFFIPDLNLALEYDGKRFHNQSNDKIKNRVILENNFNLIRIREKGLKKTTKMDIFHDPNKSLKKLLNDILKKILLFKVKFNTRKKIKKYIQKDTTQNNLKWRKEISKFPKPPKNKSLPYLFPQIAKMWDYEKNFPLKPENYLATSRFRPWWKCNKCGYSFKATIDSKTRRANKFVNTGGCKNCYKKLRPEAIRLSKLRSRGSISITHPDISKEWDFKKNKKTPDDYTMGSKTKVWFVCLNGHSSFKMMINKRTRKTPQGCPECGKIKKLSSFKKHLKETKKPITITHPYIAKEWDYKKNKTKPEEYSFGSHYVAWWKCKNNHLGFKSAIKDRTKKINPRMCNSCL